MRRQTGVAADYELRLLVRRSASAVRESRSFSEYRERVAVLVHEFVGGLHGLLKIRIVKQHLETATRKFDDMKLLAALEIEPLHRLARQDQPVGISNLFDFDLHGVESSM
jgi:hypothetical protein